MAGQSLWRSISSKESNLFLRLQGEEEEEVLILRALHDCVSLQSKTRLTCLLCIFVWCGVFCMRNYECINHRILYT